MLNKTTLSSLSLSQFIGGTTSIGLGNLSVMATGFLGVMIITRHLPVEQFGVYILVQVAAVFLMKVSNLGLDVSVTRFITAAEYENEKRKLINTLLCFQFLKTALMCVAAIITRRMLSPLFDVTQLEGIFAFVLLLFILESYGQLLKSISQGLFLFGVIAKTNFISGFLNILLIIFLVLFLDLELLGLLLSKVISITISYIFLFQAIPSARGVEFDFIMLKKILYFGIPLHFNSLLGFVFVRLDALMIGSMLGPTQLAYYEIARKIPESLQGLYDAFRIVFYSFMSQFFARNERLEATQMLNHSTRLLTFFAVLGALVALLFGDTILSTLFSTTYLPSVPAFVIIMAGLAFAFLEETIGYCLVALGDSGKPLLINIIHAAISLLGNLTLIPLFGITGAALAYVAGYAVANPMGVLFLRRKSIDVNLMAYLRPMLIFSIYVFFIEYFQPTSIPMQGTIALLFLVTSMIFSIFTVRDICVILQEAKIRFNNFRLIMWSRKH